MLENRKDSIIFNLKKKLKKLNTQHLTIEQKLFKKLILKSQ